MKGCLVTKPLNFNTVHLFFGKIYMALVINVAAWVCFKVVLYHEGYFDGSKHSLHPTTLLNERSNKNGWSHRKGNQALPWLRLQTFRSSCTVVSAAHCPGVLQIRARALQTHLVLGFLSPS